MQQSVWKSSLQRKRSRCHTHCTTCRLFRRSIFFHKKYPCRCPWLELQTRVAIFFVSQTNWLSAPAISAEANLRHGNSDILARIVQYAFPYECPQKTLVAQDDTSMLTLCSLTWSKLEYRALFLLSSQFWLWLVTIVFSIFSKRKRLGFLVSGHRSAIHVSPWYVKVQVHRRGLGTGNLWFSCDIPVHQELIWAH